MKVLKAAECHHHVGFFRQAFGLFADKEFALEVFAEIKVAQIFVDFQLVVELFSSCLVAFPKVRYFWSGHFADGFELLLQFADFVQMTMHVVCVFRRCVDLVDHGIFLVKIYQAFCFLGSCKFRFFLLYDVERCFKSILMLVRKGGKSGFFVPFGEKLRLFSSQFVMTYGKKLHFKPVDFFAGDLSGVFLRYFFKSGHNFRFAHRGGGYGGGFGCFRVFFRSDECVSGCLFRSRQGLIVQFHVVAIKLVRCVGGAAKGVV